MRTEREEDAVFYLIKCVASNIDRDLFIYRRVVSSFPFQRIVLPVGHAEVDVPAPGGDSWDHWIQG